MNNLSTTGRHRAQRLTVEFNRPVNNPILHLTSLGGVLLSSSSSSTVLLGFSAELDVFVNSATTAATLNKLSGKTELVVSGNQINNGASSIGTSNFADGSVQVIGTGITSLVFEIYLRGDRSRTVDYWTSPDGSPAVYPSTTTGTYYGDVFFMGISLDGTEPIGCDNTMYFSAGSSTQLNAIVPAAGMLGLNPVGAAAGFPYNAMAIDPLTGIMYAMRGNTNMYQINGDGTTVNLGAVSGLSTTPPQYVSGEIDPSGNYYVAQVGTVGTIYKINTTTKVATAIGLSRNIAISDMAYNVNDDLLYAVENNTGQLIYIDPVSGDITSIGVSPGNGVFGAMWGSNTGSVYAQESSGNLYHYDPATGKRVLIATGTSATGTDGAHCVTSPITFEADLSVTKTDGTANYIPGFSTTYTIVVENNGPFGVLNAHVSDPVPAGIPAINVSYTAVASSGSTTEVSGTQTGAIDDYVSLPVGGTVTYTVTVFIPASFTGDLVNTVTVTPPSNIDDVDMTNNTATDTDIPEPIPFECDGNGTIYTIKSAVTGTQLYMLDYSTSPYTEIAIGDASHGIQYHAIGYNRDDNFLYALSLPHTGAEAHKLYRIGNNGVPVELGVIAGLDTSGGTGGWNSGGFAEDGKFFVKRAILGADIYVIDINAVAIDMIIPASAYDTGDVTFANGKFYFLSRSASTQGQLVSIDYAAPHTITELPYVNSSIPGGNNGGMFSTASGKVLGIDNNGKVYHYNLTTGRATQIGTIGNWVQAAYDATSCLDDFVVKKALIITNPMMINRARK